MLRRAALVARELRKVYAFGFCWMSVPIMPVIVPFLASRGVTAGEVLTLQAVYGAAVTLFEVPTGYLCDRIGRRRTLLLGAILNVTGFSLFALVRGFSAFAAVELVLASGWSLVSGADVALIYDLLDDAAWDRQARRHALANYQLAQVLGEATAALAGGLLATWSLAIAGWANVLAALAPIGIALLLRERPKSVSRNSSPLADMTAALRVVVLTRHQRLVFLNMITWGLSTFVAVWLLQPYWREQGVSFGWFGVLWAATLVTVGVVAKSAPLLGRVLHPVGVLLVLTLCPIVGYFGMAGLGGGAGIACGFLFYVSRGLNTVHLREAFNHELPARLRATCNSFASAVFRLAFAACGPVVGAVIDQRGLRSALVLLGVVFLFAFVVVAVPLLRETRAS